MDDERAKVICRFGGIMKYRTERTTAAPLFRAIVFIALLPFRANSQPTTAGGSEQVITKARSLIYTNREIAIRILTRATEQSPRNTDAWITLVEAFHLNSEDRFADRASRRALELNPHDPQLLVSRARILEPEPALDVLAELEKLPGQQEYARDLEQLTSLSLGVPGRLDDPLLFGEWAKRLLATNRAANAAQVIERGLKLSPSDEDPKNSILLAYKAMVLATLDKVDEAMIAFEASGTKLLSVEGKYAGLSDILLSKGRPDLAILTTKDVDFPRKIAEQTQGFGSPNPDYRNLKRVLAWAYVLQGQTARARELLTEQEIPEQLLLMEIFHREKQDEQAKSVIREFMAKRPRIQGGRGGQQFRPFLTYFHGAVSLEPVYRDCVRDLIGLFPENRGEFQSIYGDPTSSSEGPPGLHTDIEPASQHIPKLIVALAAAKSPREIGTCRRNLREAYTSAGLFEEALAVAARGATDFSDDASGPNSLAVAMQWSILRHRIGAEELNRSNPQALIRSRELLLSLKGFGLRTSGFEGIDTLPVGEAVMALIALGPEILESVIDSFEPNTITATDRTPLIAIIRKLGDERDVPILAHTMMILTQNLEEPGLNYRENQIATVQSIDTALESLTRHEEPAGTYREHARFWIDWWGKNAVRIVNADPPTKPSAR